MPLAAKTICSFNIKLPLNYINNRDADQAIVSARARTKKKIKTFITDGIRQIPRINDFFSLISPSTENIFKKYQQETIKFIYNIDDSVQNYFEDFLQNQQYSKDLGYIIEKALIFDSYLNTLYTDPELNLCGVSYYKSWTFIWPGGVPSDPYLFYKVGEECPTNGPFQQFSSSSDEILSKNSHLCIMPFQTFDSYCILIQNKIINNQVIIITAGTGLGKTVRVPIYLLEIFTQPGILSQFSIRNLTPTNEPNWRDSNVDNLTPDYIDENSMILCALPKNVLVRNQGKSKVILNAVRDNSNNSSSNNLFNGEKIIGYVLKDDNTQMGEYLNFITAGFLNTKFKDDPKLENFTVGRNKKKISCVIVDEAHERSLDIDILLKNLKKVAELRPNFKIVIMSATIKACLFREYFFGEEMKYGEKLELCDDTDQETFEKFDISHVDMDIPIIHVEKDLTNLKEYYSALRLSVPNLISKPPTPPALRASATPFVPTGLLGGANSDTVNCSNSEQINVSLKYLKETCINSNLFAGLLTHLITQIKIVKKYNEGLESFKNSLHDKSIGCNILEFFERDNILGQDLLEVNDDIIIFVAGKDDAKNLWMILSNYLVFKEYDCFYFEASTVSVLRPFGTDQKRTGGRQPTWWCEKIIPKKNLPYRWPKTKPAWQNWDLPDGEPHSNDSDGRPQIIIATNAIESSITFENCGVVIDNGLELTSGYITNLNMNTLSLQPIVKASANQRKGRTGRKKSGICYRLYTNDVFNNMLESKNPDILSENLDFLFIKILDNNENFLNFDFIESPTYNQINTTMNRLIKAKLIPNNFNIYTVVKDLHHSYKEKIKAFNNIASISKLEFKLSNSRVQQDPLYFNLDLAAIDIWYTTPDNNLKLLMAFFTWISNRPIDLESNYVWGTMPSGDDVTSKIMNGTLPFCSLLALFNEERSPLKHIYGEPFNKWIEIFKQQQNFRINNVEQIDLSSGSFDHMNSILQEFNQKCNFGYIDLHNRDRIYFNTNIDKYIVNTMRGLTENKDCYFFSNMYFNGEFKFMFLNVII